MIQRYNSGNKCLNNEVHQICTQTIFEISTEKLIAEIIVTETEKDAALQEIKKKLQTESNDTGYTLDEGIIFKGNRVVIPASLRPQVLEELHATHIGITKMKQLARRYCFWKGIDHDIEQLVKSCNACAAIRNNPKKAPIHPWELPQDKWDRIHIDYAGPFEGYQFLLCIDAKSRWAEIKNIRQAPTSTITMDLLDEIFAVHGFPKVIVSDNATIFTSNTFKEYCREKGICQKFVAPGHPATNALLNAMYKH